ncbi:hypothetical protein ADU76_10025, partial [Clostridium botulinum]
CFQDAVGLCVVECSRGLGNVYKREKEALANDKGVHREVESEGSRMAKFRSEEYESHKRLIIAG